MSEPDFKHALGSLLTAMHQVDQVISNWHTRKIWAPMARTQLKEGMEKAKGILAYQYEQDDPTLLRAEVLSSIEKHMGRCEHLLKELDTCIKHSFVRVV